MYKHSDILFWIGLLGLAFYVVGPILFPEASIRQPELLPVYTLMIGLGQLLRGSSTTTMEDEQQKALQQAGQSEIKKEE